MERPEQDARSRRRSAKRKEKTAHSGGGRKKIVVAPGEWLLCELLVFLFDWLVSLTQLWRVNPTDSQFQAAYGAACGETQAGARGEGGRTAPSCSAENYR